MSIFKNLAVTAIFLLGTSLAYADCGNEHGTSNTNPHKMGKISTTNFEDLDKDKSVFVSFEEFKAVFPKTQQAGFNMLDKDEDGQLNRAEWEAFKDAHKGMGNYKATSETT